MKPQCNITGNKTHYIELLLFTRRLLQPGLLNISYINFYHSRRMQYANKCVKMNRFMSQPSQPCSSISVYLPYFTQTFLMLVQIMFLLTHGKLHQSF